MVEFQQTAEAGGGQPILTKVPLMMACSAALIALLLASVASLTGFGVVRIPETPVVAYRDLLVIDGENGKGLIRDAATGQVVLELPPGGPTGFVRTVFRGLTRERLLAGGTPDAPFRLARHADGHLILTDPVSGKRRIVDTFGPGNTEQFRHLLDTASAR